MADRVLMIDTSLLIDFFRKTDKPRTRLVKRSQQFEQLAISSVTEFEIYSGATLIQQDYWQELLREILVFPFDSTAAHKAVEILNSLKAQRKSIEKADLFIAATAVANHLPLDTLNRKHFNQISQLNLTEDL